MEGGLFYFMNSVGYGLSSINAYSYILFKLHENSALKIIKIK